MRRTPPKRLARNGSIAKLGSINHDLGHHCPGFMATIVSRHVG